MISEQDLPKLAERMEAEGAMKLLQKLLEDSGAKMYFRIARHITGTDQCALNFNLPCKNNGRTLIIISLPETKNP